jgi:cold shock protein
LDETFAVFARVRIRVVGSFCDSMSKGTVKWFNEKKGFGFIVDPEVPTDIFVHFSVIQADGFKTLNEGETVEYELYQDEKGAKAKNVVRV